MASDSRPIIVWFRQDLRLGDHPALWQACQKQVPVIPVFIFDASSEGAWKLGGASKAWLLRSLKCLGERLTCQKSRLVILKGETSACLSALIDETGAQAVYCHRRYEPAAIQLEQALQKALPVPLHCFDGALLHQPQALLNKQGKPYQVYTPFGKALSSQLPEIELLPEPTVIPAPSQWPASLRVDELPLMPPANEPRWDIAVMKHWQVREKAADSELTRFLSSAVGEYDTLRNRPDKAGTSRLSPYLHFGEISPRQVWAKAHEAMSHASKTESQSAQIFLKELVWREFSHHLLFHFPSTAEEALRPEFRNFPWQEDADFLACWQRGETGYPIVDAGMRELWATGWMHNRVRMVVGSFLVKNLLTPWQAGARWFWETLVDADLAQNTMNWQWVAGCGADAAPYFRVFNPLLQGQKFDPDGTYVRRWIPELERVEQKYTHQPWESPTIKKIGTYPKPIVEHSKTRDRALAAYKRMRQAVL